MARGSIQNDQRNSGERNIYGMCVIAEYIYGSGHESVAVLLPGFAIIW